MINPHLLINLVFKYLCIYFTYLLLKIGWSVFRALYFVLVISHPFIRCGRNSLSSSMADDSAPIPLWASELKYASCWICSEEEVRASDRIQVHLFPGHSTGLESRSRFIHPCKCSLIAHEKVCIQTLPDRFSAYYLGFDSIVMIDLAQRLCVPSVKHHTS